MRPQASERSGDLPVCLLRRLAGVNDAVVVVDGGVPDRPAHPPVVAHLGSCNASERHQDLPAVDTSIAPGSDTFCGVVALLPLAVGERREVLWFLDLDIPGPLLLQRLVASGGLRPVYVAAWYRA